MDKSAIDRIARGLQTEIYGRAKLRETGVPDLPVLFDPRHVAEHCGLFYDVRERLDTDYPGGGEAAGVWLPNRATILVSTAFSYATQRWTGAHEIGHYLLHQHVGYRTFHRELPLDTARGPRPPLEREADYFAASLLMPRGAVFSEFADRFGTKRPLALTEAVAWHLKLDPAEAFSQPPGSLLFATAVARAQRLDGKSFNGSLAQYFGVSPKAMAIRLVELDLVAPYLYEKA